MAEDVLNSVINTQVNICSILLMIFLFFAFYHKFSKILPLNTMDRPIALLNRRLVIGFTSVIFSVSIMLSILMTITAVAKNILLTANNSFPNTNVDLFHQMFPNYDEIITRAFIFSNFIPIVRTCILCFGPLYMFIELNYWGGQSDWNDATPHIQLLGKIIKQEKKQSQKRVICGLLSVFIIFIFPFSIYYFIPALGLEPFINYGGGVFGFWDTYFYFAPLIAEIILSFYLSNYSVIQISGYFVSPPKKATNMHVITPKKTNISKIGLIILQVLGIYFLIKIFISFYKMFAVFSNYTIEEIVSSETIFGLLLNFFPNNILLQQLDNIFLIFPIDFLLGWLLGFIFALKFLFHQIVGKNSQPKPRDLFFLCFVICGFITLLAYQFMVYYPWMYASSITGSIFEFSLNTATKYYPKIIAEKIFSFYFVSQFIYFQLKKKNFNP